MFSCEGHSVSRRSIRLQSCFLEITIRGAQAWTAAALNTITGQMTEMSQQRKQDAGAQDTSYNKPLKKKTKKNAYTKLFDWQRYAAGQSLQCTTWPEIYADASAFSEIFASHSVRQYAFRNVW